MSLLFIQNYKGSDAPAFEAKVKEVAADLGIDPNWLLATMWKESRLNPQAQNTKFPVGGGYATGLIQFVPDTARGLGTTTEQLYRMSGVQQMEYVRKYFKDIIRRHGRLNSYFDTYIAVFFPAAIGKPDNWVFEARNISRSAVARQNPAIDINKDNVITVAEFKEYLNGGFTATVKNALASTKAVINQTVDAIEKKKTPVIIGLLIFATVTVGLIVYKNSIIKKLNK